MATLTIEIPEAMLEFIDREVATGDYKDRSEFLETLIAIQMGERATPEPDCYLDGGKITFANEEQRERFEQKLEAALDEHERGETVPYQKGDFGRMARTYLQEKRARLVKQALALSVEEKLQLLEALWDSLSQNMDDIPVPDWQLEELERREQSQQANPQPGQTWEEVKREILKKQ